MNRSVFVSGILVLFVVAGIAAQSEYDARPTSGTRSAANTGADDTTTVQSVEDLYLSSAVTVETLGAQLLSPERTVQFLALSTLEHQIETGLIDPTNPEVLEALSPLVKQGVLVVSRGGDRSIEIYDPGVRREAVRVMGRLGTAPARASLVQTVRHDPEPTVRAEALFALARIGHDPSGEVTRTIAGMMMNEHIQMFDEGVIYAAVTAIGEIAANPDSVVDPASREMLIHVASDYRYSRMVRHLALDTLARM
ncbi:MAG: HEAT repeat domain-containing protein [Alkalispirochaeta sp.]